MTAHISLPSEKRITWVDVYKGLLILFMVLGHATGNFNGYIYQFHMAAFFFISGFLFHVAEKGLLSTVGGKLYSLLLPLVSAIVLISGAFYLLLWTGVYSVFFSEPFGGVKPALTDFFRNGNTFSVLGASWFLVTLLGVFILNKLLFLLCGKNIGFYTVAVLLLYGVGYSMAASGGVHLFLFSVDLIFIGQFYFSLGVLCNYFASSANRYSFLQDRLWKNLLWLALHLLLFFFFKSLGVVVEYPSRYFQNIFLDSAAALNGVLFCYHLALLFAKTPLCRLFSVLGKNTLGILLFHFCFFKLVFAVLARLKIVPYSDILNLVPAPSPNGSVFWPAFFMTAVIGSLLLWRLLLFCPITAVLFGDSRAVKKWLAKQSAAFGHSVSRIAFIREFSASYCRLTALAAQRLQDTVHAIVSAARRRPAFSLLLVIFAALFFFPYLQQGIMCNDELSARFYSQTGFWNFYRHYFAEHIAKGRALSTPFVSLTMYLGFIGQSTYAYKLLQVLSLMLDALCFGLLLHKLTKNKSFALFCAAMALLCLPITFEHTAPNAFTTLYNIPFAILLLSLYLWYGYLENRRRSFTVSSLVMFFVSCLCYEAFITYVPLYMLMAICKKPGRAIRSRLLSRAVLYPFMTGIAYLGCYGASRLLWPSGYEGNQISFTLSGMTAILRQLFLSAVPGYYLRHPKYQYLFTLYGQPQGLDALRLIIVLSLCAFCGFWIFRSLLGRIADRERSLSNGRPASIFLLLFVIGLFYMWIPALPLSVSSMYQGNVDADHFTALPTSYFLHYAAILCLCILVYAVLRLMRRVRKTVIPPLLCIVLLTLCLLIGGIQTMNAAFARQQHTDAERIAFVEECLSLNLWHSLENVALYSSDIYETRNALYVDDQYWQRYAQVHELPMQIVNTQASETDAGAPLSRSAYCLRTINDRYLLFYNDRYAFLMSRELLPADTLVFLGENSWADAGPLLFFREQDVYIYCADRSAPTEACSWDTIAAYNNT